jgi:hypothetical protein
MPQLTRYSASEWALIRSGADGCRVGNPCAAKQNEYETKEPYHCYLIALPI